MVDVCQRNQRETQGASHGRRVILGHIYVDHGLDPGELYDLLPPAVHHPTGGSRNDGFGLAAPARARFLHCPTKPVPATSRIRYATRPGAIATSRTA